jgi:hypothetical protein
MTCLSASTTTSLALPTVGHLGDKLLHGTASAYHLHDELWRVRGPLMVTRRTGAGEGGADCQSERPTASSNNSSSGSEDAPLSFLTMVPTRPPTLSSAAACVGQHLIDDGSSATGGVLAVEQHPPKKHRYSTELPYPYPYQSTYVILQYLDTLSIPYQPSIRK